MLAGYGGSYDFLGLLIACVVEGVGVKSCQVVLLTTALVLAGLFCLRPPAMPQWDTTLAVPLYQTTLRLVDFLDTSRFKVGPDSTLSFAAKFQIDTVTPAGVVDLVNTHECSRIQLPDFVLSGFCAIRTRVGLEELIGRSIPDSGTKQPVPAFERTFERAFEFSDIVWAEIARARAGIRVTNHTGLVLDSVALVFPFGCQVVGPLAAGESRLAEFDIGGTFVQSPVPALAVIGSAGTTGGTVRLSKTDSVALEFKLDSVQVVGARCRLPAARGQRWCRVMTRSTKPFKADSMVLAAGTCQIEVANDFGLPLEAEVRVPKLGRTVRCRLAGHGVSAVDLDLTGVKVDNRSRTNSLLDFEVVAVLDQTDEYVDLTKADGLTVNHTTRSLEPERVAGTFTDAVYVAARLDTLPRFLPSGMHGVRVPSADVVLDLDNCIGFPLALSLELAAVRNGAVVARSVQSLTIPAGTIGFPTAGTWVLPITDLVNAGPDAITMTRTVRIFGQGNYERSAWIAGRAAISTPMRFAMVPDTVPTPARRITIAQSPAEAASRYFVSGRATLSFKNHFPTGFAGWLLVKPDSSALPVSGVLTDDIVFPFAVPRGRIDRLNNCVGESDTIVQIELDSVQITMFRKSPLAAQLFLALPATDTLNYRATDRLHVNALLELEMRVAP